MSGAPLDRLHAVDMLARRGERGHAALADIALDANASADARIAAEGGLSADDPLDRLASVAGAFLEAEDPVLCYRGIRLCVRTGLASMRPKLEALTGDRRTFWELDVPIEIAGAARAATLALDGSDRS